MEAKANYTIVGFTVVVLTLSLIAVMIWLSAGFEKKKYRQYVVYMHEAVSGLNEDSLVKYNGVVVGQVKKITLDTNNPQRVKLLLSIEEQTPITKSTYATLISQGITGVTYVGLATSSASLTPLKQLPDQPYPVIPSRPSMFNQLDKALKEITVNINTLSRDIKKVFDKENRYNLKQTLKKMNTVASMLAKNKNNFNTIMENTRVFSADLAKASKTLPELIHEMRVMSNTVAKAGISAAQTMSAGKLAINKISQQTLPPFNHLLQRLEETTANLEQVSELMRQNPAVIIRGTTPPVKGPGE